MSGNFVVWRNIRQWKETDENGREIQRAEPYGEIHYLVDGEEVSELEYWKKYAFFQMKETTSLWKIVELVISRKKAKNFHELGEIEDKIWKAVKKWGDRND